MKTQTGKIVSLKTAQTATVLVETKKTHPVYKKVIKKSKKYPAHYELDLKLKKGNLVQIIECRTLSKTKKWRVVKVLSLKDKKKK